jgi:hypothetical protein
MLVIGEFDTNVDPSSGYQVANALIQAGKYFDLLVVPNGGHGAGGQYAARKRNDFFVQWLLGVQPPNWNGGATDAAVGGGAGRVGTPGAGAPGADAPPMDFPGDDALGPSFYDGPDDPPYVWW